QAFLRLRIWLILLFFTPATVISEAQSSDKKQFPECKDEMACFATDVCVGRTDSAIIPFTASENININCPAVLKIRVYSKKYWLVVMQSFDQTVKSITVHHGTKLVLSCAHSDSQTEALYKTDKIGLISKNDSPLMCEFFVSVADEVLAIPTGDSTLVTLSAGKSSPSTMTSVLFSGHIFFPTCDPTNISPGEVSLGGDILVKEIDGKYSNLVCPEKYRLEFHDSSVFKQVDSIVCEMNANRLSEYVVTEKGNVLARKAQNETFNARCALPTCSLCDFVPRPDYGVEPIIDSNAKQCKVLKCADGRLKAGGKYGIADCKYDKNGQSFWQLGVDGNRTRIDPSTKVKCIPKDACNSTTIKPFCDRGEPGRRCIISREDYLPYCSNNNLEVNGVKEANITCDEDTGEYRLNGGKLPENAK
ncbi:hypothetical protein PFISCL1PPCAC_11583, partial [Pristionchus fissidentatus]